MQGISLRWTRVQYSGATNVGNSGLGWGGIGGCRVPGRIFSLGGRATRRIWAGDCCADLEERVAELEATTARKGNRKVSLTVSGWVNQAVFFWDDGVEKNAYVGTNELEQDRFRFVGEAKISDGWTAGYILEIGVNGAGSKRFAQDSLGDANNSSPTVRRPGSSRARSSARSRSASSTPRPTTCSTTSTSS